MERWVEIAGLALSIEVDGPEREHAVEAMFGHCERADERPQAGIVEVDTLDVPARRPEMAGREVESWIDDDGVTSQHRSGVTARRRGEHIEVAGRGGVDPDRSYRLAVQFPLMDLFSLTGRHVIHAAAVEMDGRAVLATGGSGAGKSTFAFSASRHGGRVISDDLSIVTTHSGELCVSGFPKPMKVPAEILGEVPASGTPIPHDARRRWALPTSSTVARGQYPIDAVVWVGHGSGPDRTERLPTEPDRLREWMSSNPLCVLPRVMRPFFAVSGQLARLPTFRFDHARDPQERVAAVGRFLDRIASGADEPALDSSQ